MKLRAIHLFLLLILSLLLSSVLGGQNQYIEGMSSGGQPTSSYVGPAGDTVNTYGGTQEGFSGYVEGMSSGGQPTGSYVGPAGDTVNTYGGSSQSGQSQDNYNGYDSTATGSSSYSEQSGNTATIIYPQSPPHRDDDLYILKSQIVPPVCPACPSSSSCPRQDPCPACPACARCPEPSFECKKVPNYKGNDNSILPMPVLNDFGSFGM